MNEQMRRKFNRAEDPIKKIQLDKMLSILFLLCIFGACEKDGLLDGFSKKKISWFIIFTEK